MTWDSVETDGSTKSATNLWMAIGSDNIPRLIGYTSVSHLAPAVAGCLLYIAGLVLTRPARSAAARESPV